MRNHTKAAYQRRFESEGCCSLLWLASLPINGELACRLIHRGKTLLFRQADTGMFSFLLVSICGVTKSC